MAGYHFGWWDIDSGEAAARSGKRLRPALLLSAVEAYGGSLAAAAPAAAAVELLHNFTLIHDDVMDRDRFRFGRATIWHVWGTADAILLGDTMQSMATGLLAARLPGPMAVGAINRLVSTSIELCRGQQLDCAFEERSRVDMQEYLEMAMAKTGTLMGLACALGTLCAGMGSVEVEAMDRFGRELGSAFQFVDDLLGIWGDPRVTGKPAGRDLARRKRSLPVVAALESEDDRAGELAELYRAKSRMTAADIARATVLVEDMGGRLRTEWLVGERVSAALAALPDRLDTADLLALTDAAINRRV